MLTQVVYSLGKSLLVGLICKSFSSAGGGSRRLGLLDSSSSYRLEVLFGLEVKLQGSGGIMMESSCNFTDNFTFVS